MRLEFVDCGFGGGDGGSDGGYVGYVGAVEGEGGARARGLGDAAVVRARGRG